MNNDSWAKNAGLDLAATRTLICCQEASKVNLSSFHLLPLLPHLLPAVPPTFPSSRLPAGLQFLFPAASCCECMKPHIMCALKQPKPNLAGNEKLSGALLNLRACQTARRRQSEALVGCGPVLADSCCLTALSGGRCSCRRPRNLASAVPLCCWHCDGN
jgi:hypothetical protein